MFKSLFKNRSTGADTMRIETENYTFVVTNKAEIKDVEFRGTPVIKSISFADPLPFGLRERFEDAYRDLEDKAFNNLTNTLYKLSAERGRSKTTIFASGRVSIAGFASEVKIIITANQKQLIVEVRTNSLYKSFWGITATILGVADTKARKAERGDLRVFKRSEQEPRMSYVLANEKSTTLIMSTYGSGKANSENEVVLRPTVDGTDREVVNSWRVTNDLSNYNTIVIQSTIRET